MSPARGCAGFVSGPSRLNVVGIPSSRRGPPACRRAGWKAGAKQKPMPRSPTLRATSSGSAPMRTPSASSTSAAPDFDDAARLPCLTTGVPAAATTSAVIVEMLTDPDRSPPVPTMSTVRTSSSTRRACASMARAIPAISAAVSPLARNATANPAICAGVASPDITWSMAHAVPSSDRSVRSMRALRTEGQVCSDIVALRNRRRPPRRQGRRGDRPDHFLRGPPIVRRSGGLRGPAARPDHSGVRVVGHGRVPATGHPRTVGRWCERSTSATVSAAVNGSSGWTSTASACDQVASHRSSARRTATTIGGQSSSS